MTIGERQLQSNENSHLRKKVSCPLDRSVRHDQLCKKGGHDKPCPPTRLWRTRSRRKAPSICGAEARLDRLERISIRTPRNPEASLLGSSWVRSAYWEGLLVGAACTGSGVAWRRRRRVGSVGSSSPGHCHWGGWDVQIGLPIGNRQWLTAFRAGHIHDGELVVGGVGGSAEQGHVEWRFDSDAPSRGVSAGVVDDPRVLIVIRLRRIDFRQRLAVDRELDRSGIWHLETDRALRVVDNRLGSRVLYRSRERENIVFAVEGCVEGPVPLNRNKLWGYRVCHVDCNWSAGCDRECHDGP